MCPTEPSNAARTADPPQRTGSPPQANASRCLATNASTLRGGGAPPPPPEIVGPRENTVGVIDGDLAQMLDQERAAGLAGDAIGLRVKRPRVIARRLAHGSARHQLRPFFDGH